MYSTPSTSRFEHSSGYSGLSLVPDRRFAPRPCGAWADRGPDGRHFVERRFLWEAAIKIRAGKLVGSLPAMIEEATVNGFRLLAVKPSHLLRLMSLPVQPRHRDPFDHLLLAQAAAEGLPLMTSDRALHAYGTALMDAAA